MRHPLAARLALIALLAPSVARGGFTSPTLVLSAASGAAVDGVRSAALEGSFDFPNVVQADYPLELVVFQSAHFVRYPFGHTPLAGDSPELGDGVLAQSELGALVQEGSAAPATVRVVGLTATSLRVSLPASFIAGPATAVLFTILPDGSVLSNPITFTLP